METTDRDSHPRQPLGPSARRGRVRTVCTECRKAKVRCNVDQVPCSRCLRLQLRCHLDGSSTKRSVVSKHSRSAHKAHAIREPVDDGSAVQAHSLDTDVEVLQTRKRQSFHRGNHNDGRENGVVQSSEPRDSSPFDSSPPPFFQLGDVSLTEELASELFAS